MAHQNRLRFHTETELVKSELSPYYNDFIGWICTEKPELLPGDKVERFKQLLTCPLSTNQLTEAIALSWSRVFEADDKFFRYDFDNPEEEKDWEEYRDCEFWETDGFKAMINAIDSVWVVDLPSEQSGEKPEPKDMLIDISNVIDLSVNRNGECNYLIFTLNDKLFVYDSKYIRTFDYKDKELKGDPIEFDHGLTYCPARMFWTTLLNSKNYINHKAPLTNVLTELDWLLVHKTFKKNMDIANSYPILVTYKIGDDSTDLVREDNKGRNGSEQKTLGGAFVGPGTILQLDVPMEGQPDLMANPVKWIAPEIDTLKFHVSEDVRLTDYIYKTAVGIDKEPKNDQAQNEKQVLASFENQTIILLNIAKNFENVQTFADKVKIAIRYNKEVNVSISYGSKFFLKTAEDLMKEVESLSSDEVMSDAVYKELIDAKFRNDTGGVLRARVMRDLDPLPGKTIDEVILIKNAGGIDDTVFKIKMNFLNYVLRFEREQLPLDQFFKGDDYSNRINKVKEEFVKYASESVKVKSVNNNQNQENENEEENSGEHEPGSGDQ